jgi:hypothetical protein
MAKELKVCLNEWDARLIIQALAELETKWQHINETSPDEDEQAEYGNDLVILGETKDGFVEAAVQAFGESITTFSRIKV